MEARDLLFLFYRPLEPIFFPKKVGKDTAIFDIPLDFLPNQLKRVGTIVLNRFNFTGYRLINVGSYVQDNFYEIDFSDIMRLSRDVEFSHFSKMHVKIAARMITLLMDLKDYKEIIEYCAFLHDRVNPGLFVYALSVVMSHRDDLRHLTLPLYWQIFPKQFVDAGTIRDAVSMANVNEASNREPIDMPINYTGTTGDPEHRLAYWREDIGLNLHHWHWHLVYPIAGPRSIVNKDRRGELFYYLHHQIISRYNIERLCNQLNLVKRMTDLREPIEVGYYPKLNTTVASRTYPHRQAGMRLQNVRRSQDLIVYDIADLERWRTRLFDAIHTKTVIGTDGKPVKLDAMTGIDIIANIVEPSQLGINSTFYGELHNAGHDVIACIHDPQGHYKEPIGVMGTTSTAMRDPVFYQWHSFLDDLFMDLKDSFEPYTDAELNFSALTVSKISVAQLNKPKKENQLSTFWQKNTLDLSRGLDFSPSGPIYVRVTYLNHEEFEYSIKVMNNDSAVKNGTVRIFMAPVNDFEDNPLSFNEQRKLMIEMDKFVSTFQPGSNVIRRKSTESNVTIPFEQTFRDLNEERPQPSSPEALDKFNFCGCGWPQYLLLPKGSASGYPMKLFVMVSNYEDDKIEQLDPKCTDCCKTGVVFCGLKDLKYPDKRSMGYPFDRVAPGVSTLNQFLKPNMKAIDVIITHNNKVKQSS